jgi:alpha-tubulin suppressor-like RCC1 family protein
MLSETIVKVAAGFQHSLLLNDQGAVYGTGRSEFRAFGTPAINKVKPHMFV